MLLISLNQPPITTHHPTPDRLFPTSINNNLVVKAAGDNSDFIVYNFIN
jgi:hypothetical protein